MISILIAEDLDLLREDMTELLNAQPDMQVVGTASTGAKILELAKSVKSDVVLMDIEMESLSAGIMAAEAIRDAGIDTRVVYLTAHETEKTILTAMATGAADYIVKGCPDAELLEHIRSVYAGHPMMDSRIQEVVLEEYNRLRRSERACSFYQQCIPAHRRRAGAGQAAFAGQKVKEIAAIRCVEVVTVNPDQGPSAQSSDVPGPRRSFR